MIQYHLVRIRDHFVKHHLVVYLFSYLHRAVVDLQTSNQNSPVVWPSIYFIRIEISQALVIAKKECIATEKSRAVAPCYIIIVEKMLMAALT